MELQKKFDKWLEDEKFVTFANKRLKDEDFTRTRKPSS